MRPGRFDRSIQCDPPDVKGRREILMIYLAKLTLAEPIDEVAEKLSTLTPGMSGAELANVCNEAALIAARHKKESVSLTDFNAAMDRVVGGLEKKSKVRDLDG